MITWPMQVGLGLACIIPPLVGIWSIYVAFSVPREVLGKESPEKRMLWRFGWALVVASALVVVVACGYLLGRMAWQLIQS